MELRQLQAFVLAAELGTITRAAERLFISQPALSRQIQALERELGVKLFHRSRKQIWLTDVGEQFLSRVRSALRDLDQARSIAEEASMGTGGTLTVAAGPIPMRYVVAPAAARIRNQVPGLEIRLIEEDYDVVLSLLRSGDVQMAIQALVPGMDDLSWEPLYTARLYAVFALDHPLTRKSVVSVDELTHERLLLTKSGRSTDVLYEVMYDMAGFHPVTAFVSHSPETLLLLAEARVGIAVVSDSVNLEGYAVRALPVVHMGEQVIANVVVAWHRRRPLSPAGVRFVDMLRECSKERVQVTVPK